MNSCRAFRRRAADGREAMASDVERDPEAFFDALDSFDTPEPSPSEIPAPPHSSLLRRRSSSKVDDDAAASQPHETRSRRGRTGKILSISAAAADDDGASSGLASERNAAGSEAASSEKPETLSESAESRDESADHGLLVAAADFVLKAVMFQTWLLVSSVKFPFWLLHFSFLVASNPLGTLILLKNGAKAASMSACMYFFGKISPLVPWRVGRNAGAWRMAKRVAWGCCLGLYVCLVLLGLAAMAFFWARMVVGWVAEEPLVVQEELSFDYTKANPDSIVWLIPNSNGGSCGLGVSGGNIGAAGKHADWRPVPPDHKLQVTISLTLPESEYNRKVGVFQVRTELLSANGKITFSSSQPCMLQYKSSHIRFVETFLKSGTLLTGYSSESQTLKLKMRGHTQGGESSVCIRVVIEQRAEYRPTVGIPEIYSASLKLESKLAFFRSVVWSWKWTLFIWISLGLFVFELLIILVCCPPIIIPRMGSAVGFFG